ncbi:T9SS type A sorting domain-containing protein [Winogradskyella eckloniae]|uniref:T9SS type A sorting domain-containing protein n=1 Tax=Winogradskyella eckloniae TaxID=1089306 RepID=UPI0015665F7A|nr:T9SS type A sorting domain-containing protein [Winogradskyella eckloniae]NRD19523.1 T9SS type A sorting domain-containing protein [Winogradskyella eckloniae]
MLKFNMRKTIVVSLFSTVSLLSYAQLSVRHDNFIFVNDEIVFVNNAITLGESDSKFYLREEAQLIQGEETSLNTGIGELSVYQTGNSSNYTYNYWCSPVGNNSMALGNEASRVNLIDEATNNITVQDPTGLISSVDVAFTSSFDGFSSPSLTISNRWLYTFSTSNDYADWNYVGSTLPILPGLGFTMKGVTGTNKQLYDFRGKANNGTISNLVTAEQFTLIGNPYPSAIDALLFIHDPQNTTLNNGPSPHPATTGALYFWEQRDEGSHNIADYVGGYASYTISDTGMESFVNAMFSAYDGSGNPVVLAPSPGGNMGTKISKRYIPIGQGFMVEGASGIPTGSSVYVKNAHRVYEKISDNNSVFFRSASVQKSASSTNSNEDVYNEYGLNIVPDDFKRFRLNITFNDEITRQLVHNFNDMATSGFDYGLEAKLPGKGPSDAFWVLGDEAYSIQASPFSTDLAIPITVSSNGQQPLKFSIFDVQNFDETQAIYLHDMVNNTYIDLTQQDYLLNIEAGNFSSRFQIVFTSNNALSQDMRLKEQFDIFIDNDNALFTLLNPNFVDIESFIIYDINGREVINYEITSLKDSYQYSSKNLSDGIYITKIKIRGNTSFSKKLIVSQK